MRVYVTERLTKLFLQTSDEFRPEFSYLSMGFDSKEKEELYASSNQRSSEFEQDESEYDSENEFSDWSLLVGVAVETSTFNFDVEHACDGEYTFFFLGVKLVFLNFPVVVFFCLFVLNKKKGITDVLRFSLDAIDIQYAMNIPISCNKDRFELSSEIVTTTSSQATISALLLHATSHRNQSKCFYFF